MLTKMNGSDGQNNPPENRPPGPRRSKAEKIFSLVLSLLVLIAMIPSPLSLYADPGDPVQTTKTAERVGENLWKVTLNLTGDSSTVISTSPLDVVLVLDTSGSMTTARMTAMKNASATLIDSLVASQANGDLGQTRVGVVSYASAAQERAVLTDISVPDNVTLLKAAINALTAYGNTYTNLGINQAATTFAGSTNPRYMVVLSDGIPSDHNAAVTAATNFKNGGGHIITIGLEATTAAENYLRAYQDKGYYSGSSGNLSTVFAEVAQKIVEDIPIIQSGKVTDPLGPAFEYAKANGSAPITAADITIDAGTAALIQAGRAIEWSFAAPVKDATMFYYVRLIDPENSANQVLYTNGQTTVEYYKPGETPGVDPPTEQDFPDPTAAYGWGRLTVAYTNNITSPPPAQNYGAVSDWDLNNVFVFSAPQAIPGYELTSVTLNGTEVQNSSSGLVDVVWTDEDITADITNLTGRFSAAPGGGISMPVPAGDLVISYNYDPVFHSITQRYATTDGAQLLPDIVLDFVPRDSAYNATAPNYDPTAPTQLTELNGYVAVGVQINALPPVILTSGFPQDITAAIPSVQEDHTVTFLYKADKNGDRIPDDDAGQEFTVTELYFLDGGPQIAGQPSTSTIITATNPADGSFNYSKIAPPITDYVAVGYKIGSGTTQYIPTFPGVVTAAISNVTTAQSVYFYYKDDKNNNGIPDDDPREQFTIDVLYTDDDGGAPLTPTVDTIDLPDLAGSFDYMVTAEAIEDFVVVSYTVDPGTAGEYSGPGGGCFFDDVTADHTIVFHYKEDKNNNGKPDDNESDYTVTVNYQDADGAALTDPVAGSTELTVTLPDQNGFYDYTAAAPAIPDYVAVSYTLDGAPAVPRTSYVFDDVTADHTIIFNYKDDKNNNGVPDDDPSEHFTIGVSYTDVDGGTTLTPAVGTINLPDNGSFDYMVTADAIEDYVAVSYTVDQGTASEIIGTGDSYAFTDVTADHAINFNYKVDKNNNGIPDDDPSEQFTISVSYTDEDGGTILTPTVETINLPDQAGSFDYTVTAEAIEDFVAVSYELDGGTAVPGTSYSFEDVDENHTIIFNYKDDKNNNGVPDDDPGEQFTISETYVDAAGTVVRAATTTDLPDGNGYFDYSKTAPADITDYVAVGYQIDGGAEQYIAAFPGAVTVEIEDVQADHDVRFIYKEDKNNNGKPDDTENDYTVTATLVSEGATLVSPTAPDGSPVLNPTVYPVRRSEGYNLAEPAPLLADYVAVGYEFAGGPFIPGARDAGTGAYLPLVIVYDAVPADLTADIVYKTDKNNNGVPDDEPAENFTVSETYVDAAGAVVHPATTTDLPDGNGYFDYSKTAPADITDYVAVGYQIDGGTAQYISAFPGAVTVAIDDVQADHDVRFIYKDDKNNNGVPDDEPTEEFTIGVSYTDVDGGTTLTPAVVTINLPDQGGSYDYTVTAEAIEDFVAVSYNLDGGVAVPGTSYSFTDVDENHTINFNYKDDRNNNGTPDDEETNDYVITVNYLAADHNGDPVVDPATGEAGLTKDLPDNGSYDYPAVAPAIADYVAVSYTLDGAAPVAGTAYDFQNVDENHTINFNYKDDRNNNGTPDDEETQGYSVAVSYRALDNSGAPLTDPATAQTGLTAQLPDQNGLFDYTAVAPAIPDYVAVSYNLDGSSPATDGTSYFFDDVSANRTITFNYKDDRNNNGVPDDDPDEEFTISVSYTDEDGGTTLTPGTETINLPDQGGSYDYTVTADPIEDFVVVGYTVDQGTANEIVSTGDSYFFDDVTEDHTIIFHYKDDRNNNGTPDDEETNDYVVTVNYLAADHNGAPVVDPATGEAGLRKDLPDNGSYDYPAVAPAIADYVAVSYTLDGGTPVPGTSYLFDDVDGNHTINFNYKDDRNNNGTPDDEETQGYSVAVSYRALDNSGAPLTDPATAQTGLTAQLPDQNGLFDYTAVAPAIPDYVAVSYNLDGGSATDGTSYFFDDVSANRTIIFNYKDDKNNNGVPDDDPDENFTINVSYSDEDGGTTLTPGTGTINLPDQDGSYDYTVTADPIEDFVVVGYTVDPGKTGEIRDSGDSYFFDDVDEDHTIIFHYKDDKNNNGTPDDEETQGYSITIDYRALDGGAALSANGAQTATAQLPDQYGSFDYTAYAPDIEDYVAVSYSLDGGAQATDGTSYFFDDVSANRTITFNYKDDRNNNGVPDDETDEEFTISVSYTDEDGGTALTPGAGTINLPDNDGSYDYTVTADPIEEFVVVGYTVDPGTAGEISGTGDSYFFDDVDEDHTIIFHYKDDKNNNGQPDETEGDYTVTVSYLDENGAELYAPEQYPVTAQDGYNFWHEAPELPGYLAASFQFEGHNRVEAGIDAGTGLLEQPLYVFFDSVVADIEATVIYTRDANGNGIPDGEEYFTLTVNLTDEGGAPVASPRSTTVTGENDFEVDIPAPTLNNYVAIGYQFAGENTVAAGQNSDGSYQDLRVTHGSLDADTSVNIIYASDRNGNRIPDEAEGDYTVRENFISNTDAAPLAVPGTTTVSSANGYYYSKTLQGEIEDYIAIGYQVDNNPAVYRSGFPGAVFVELSRVSSDHQVTFIFARDVNDNDVPDSQEAGQFSYTIHYYKNGVDPAGLLRDVTVTGVSLEDVIKLTQEQLNALWPQYGYYMGVQQGAPIVIRGGENNINVVYPRIELSDPRLTITHKYYRSSVDAYDRNLEGNPYVVTMADPLSQRISDLLVPRPSTGSYTYTLTGPIRVVMYPIVYIVEDDTEVGGGGVLTGDGILEDEAETEADVPEDGAETEAAVPEGGAETEAAVTEDGAETEAAVTEDGAETEAAVSEDGVEIGADALEDEADVYAVADDAQPAEYVPDDLTAQEVLIDQTRGVTMELQAGDTLTIDNGYIYHVQVAYTRKINASGGGGGGGGGGSSSGGSGTTTIPDTNVPLAVIPETEVPLGLPPEEEDDELTNIEDEGTPLGANPKTGNVSGASGAASLMALLGGILMNRLRRK
jgi:uncharacterized protein YegL